jgi:hypothetical protein
MSHSRAAPEVAKSYYDNCINFMGSSTILGLVEDEGLVIDIVLSNPFSNKAILQQVVLKRKPYVIKYPLDSSLNKSLPESEYIV